MYRGVADTLTLLNDLTTDAQTHPGAYKEKKGWAVTGKNHRTERDDILMGF